MHRNPNVRNIIRRTVTIAVTAVPALLVAATPAWAADSIPFAVYDLPTVVGNITAFITSIIAVVATLFLTIGGAQYLMAGGDPAQVERAKGSLKSAGIGYALAVLAPILLTILQQILGG
ncbi:pilin [Dactylosporangium sp. McL0621]|uniref:pilin n=1 Tax=Dactylosporangium sp. McL0621 TaxID=3415678 RepID=UPI003CE99E95